jgi:hypothetical protein
VLVTVKVAAKLGKATPKMTGATRLTTSACRASFESIRRCEVFEEVVETEDGRVAQEATVKRRADEVAMGGVP